MSARWAVPPDLGRRLGSWRLSVALMVLAGLYYAFLAVWSTASPPHVVQNIASLLPFWLLYGLLLLNTGLCLWQRLPVLKRDVGREPRWSGKTPDWTETIDLDGAATLLRERGYRTTISTDDRLVGIKKRWTALGTFLFHGAFFLVAAGFLLTLMTRQEAKVWVAAGEDYTASREQFLSTSPPRALAAGVPPLDFRVETIRPEFWRGELLFTVLEAELALPGGQRTTTRINRPVWFGGATFVRLSGFGYAPRYELVDRYGHVLDSAFVKLNVFPPGQRDHFVLPDYPHRFYLQVFPDYEDRAGEPATRSFDLVDPGVALRVVRGRLDLGSRVLRADDGFDFEGLSLRFPEIRYWGEFSIVRDPGAPVLFVGYLVGLAGLLLRLRGRREDAEWRDGELRGWGGAA